MKQIILSILLLTLFGCGETEKKSQVNSNDVIIEAVNLIYNDLIDGEKDDMIFTKCCCYPKNWNNGIDCVEKEDAFYVKTKININFLAALTESDAFKKDYLISENPHTLYGKYKNRWKFIDVDGNEICPTSKFDGHNDFRLIRNDTIDEVIIGPLPKRPKKMIIEILNSKYYPDMIPEYVLK